MVGPKPYSTNPATVEVSRFVAELRDYADASAVLASFTRPAVAGAVVRAEVAYEAATHALARAVATAAGVPTPPAAGTPGTLDRAEFTFRPWVGMNPMDESEGPVAGIEIRHLPCWDDNQPGAGWECSTARSPSRVTAAHLDEIMREHAADCPALRADGAR